MPVLAHEARPEEREGFNSRLFSRFFASPPPPLSTRMPSMSTTWAQGTCACYSSSRWDA